MVIWSYLKGGIRSVWKHKLLALILFLFKLFFAFLFLIPAYSMFSRTFSFSVLSTNFLKGYDFYLLVDFFSQWDKGLDIYKVYFLIIGIIFIFSHIFFSGGLWGALLQGLKQEIYRLRGEKFFADCGKNFGSFLKIFIFVCIAYILVFILALFIFSFTQALTGRELSYTTRILILFLEILILAILFMLVHMWSIYLRIHSVFLEEKKLLSVLRPSLNFIIKNFGRTLLLYYLLGAILVVSLIIYFGLNKTLHLLSEERFVILILFITQQGFSIFRSFFRLVSYSSQMVLFNKLHALK